MPLASAHISPSADFWRSAARTILRKVEEEALGPLGGSFHRSNLAWLRIVVPSSHHVASLKRALADAIGAPFAAPQILTLPRWLSLLPPDANQVRPASDAERMMNLYAELREHAWLKAMFAARRNADLLPLAKTLVALSDELTCAMLPLARRSSEEADARWLAALGHLPPPARKLLSDETELVWTVWKSQLDRGDPLATRFAAMLRLAESCGEPLVWIGATPSNSLERAFLDAYATRRPVLRIGLDWHHDALNPLWLTAWPELCAPAADAAEPASDRHGDEGNARLPSACPALSPARNLEDEAVRGAQTVVDWLQSGRQAIAVVAQDRAVARRIRALLDRAGVHVADETGWKLSTTRAASAIDAWFDVVATQGRTVALLDFLKSPFVLASRPDRLEMVMEIELALRRAKVSAGWAAAIQAAGKLGDGREVLKMARSLAIGFSGRKALAAWRAVTHAVLDAFEMRAAMEEDEAAAQVLAVIDGAARGGEDALFSFSEWRALLGMQLESMHFVASMVDRRVTLLPLCETRLRHFDAALIVGADAAHLPAQGNDLLFFANNVRRELGLTTCEDRQRQELRDLAALMASVPETALSWQEWRNGEPNPVSGWIRRLQMALRVMAAPAMPVHPVRLTGARLERTPVPCPAPRVPQRLPEKLSASAFARLIDCPYQFFAHSLLGLAPLEESGDLPEKRDYGDWVHEILHRFHERLAGEAVEPECREAVLADIADEVFGAALERHGAALSFYARWKRAAPAYLAWAARREDEGWRYVSGEVRLERMLQWPGGQLALHGRIDRIDQHVDGRRAVLDYKTSAPARLKKKMDSGEDCQLAFYGLLDAAGFDAAHYVAIDSSEEAITDLEARGYPAARDELERRVVECMQAIASGAALNANGIEAICQVCGMRGLCRKGAWS